MRLRILGPIDAIDDDGANVPLGGPAQLRLLAILSAASSAPVGVDDLAHQLWSDEDRPEDPVGTIRTYIARVRRALGPDAVLTGTGAYALGPSISTDAARFEELVERARRLSGSPAAPGLWRQALDLWRGPAFAEFADLESVAATANRLEELRAEATEAWFDARLAAGEGRELVGDVETAIGNFPLREGFRAQQMTVLARAGRQAEALRAFQQFRAELTEIGLEPGARLVELDGEISKGQVPRSGARRMLRGYELLDRIGEGAFAQVWKATQASVDRTVAVKQIRSELADDPAFVAQFEAEAQLIARIEHPHIVPLYDFWREPGSAYLVMRHLEGGSLAGRLLDGPSDVADVVRWVTQVAAALDAAHDSGVIHRDIKPANILLDGADNAYLSDFGIATNEAERLDPEAWLSNGSPAYAAPEQLQRQPVGPAADLYAFGITVFEALTGRLPFGSETTMAGLLERQLHDPIPLVRSWRPELPSALDAVLQRATAKPAPDRYQSAGDFARDLTAAAGLGPSETLVSGETRNPYKGLRPFQEADAADFAGRDRLVSELLRAVGDHRLVTVVGPSGSGKSSAVKAGLLPALRSDRLPGSSRWFIATMTPGDDPMAELTTALLGVAIDPPIDLIAQINGASPETGATSDGLARLLRRIVPTDRQLVLLIDQFEEVFTLTGERKRRWFLDSLLTALADEQSRLRVVLTLRADFYDHPLRDVRLAPILRRAMVPVLPLAADELELAITEPASVVGARFEPGLVARLTAEVADQPGGLPLLQHTLGELYEQRQDGTMTIATYEKLGGLAGAVGQQADAMYDSLDAAQQRASRALLGRLVNLGDGTEDTKRRVRRRDLPQDDATAAVIDLLGQARLLAFDRERSSREPTVEISHEALLTAWPRLRSWLDEDREGLRIRQHVEQAASSWEDRGRQPGDLYRAGRLETALEWSAEYSGNLNPAETAFLAASEELAAAEQQREVRRLRRLRRLLVVLASATVVAVAAGGLALVQQNRANLRAEEAELASIIARSAAEGPNRPEVGLLLAAEAYQRDTGPASQRALLTALASTPNRIRTITGPAGFARSTCTSTVSPGRYLGGQSPTVLVDIDDGAQELPVDSECFAALSPDGARVAYSALPTGLVIADTATGQPLLRSFEDTPVNNISWTPDGTALTVGLGTRGADAIANGTLVTIDAESGAEVDRVELPIVAVNHRWLDDGRFLVDPLLPSPEGPPRVTVTISDGPSEPAIVELPGHAHPVADIQTRPGRGLVVTADADGVVRLWSEPSGDLEAEIDTGLNIASVSLDTQGSSLVVAAGSVLWEVDVVGQRLVGELARFSASVSAVDHLPDGTLAVLTTDGRLTIVDTSVPSTAETTVPCCAEGIGSTLALDQSVATAFDQRGGDQIVGHTLVDPATGDRIAVNAADLGVTDAGPLVALPNRRAVIWDSSGELVWVDDQGQELDRRRPFGDDRTVVLLSGSLSGTYIAWLVVLDDLDAPFPTGFAVVDLETGQVLNEIVPFDPEERVINWGALPDGSFVGITVAGNVWRWSADGIRDAAPLATDGGTSLRVSPGSWLVPYTTLDDTIAVVDARTGEEVFVAPGLGGEVFPAVGPEDRHLVVVDTDGQSVLYDLELGVEIGPLTDGSAGATRARPVFAEDGSSVWLATGAAWREYPLDPTWWLDRACVVAGRDFTDLEWADFVSADQPRRPVCS